MPRIPDVNPEPLWTDKELAAFLQIHPSTPKQWRLKREGPPFVKIGGAVRYRRDEVELWLQRNTKRAV